MAAVQKVVTAVRSSRSNYGLTVREKAALMLACTDGALAADLTDMAQEIATLSSSSSVRILQVTPMACSHIVTQLLPAGLVFRLSQRQFQSVVLDWEADRLASFGEQGQSIRQTVLMHCKLCQCDGTGSHQELL